MNLLVNLACERGKTQQDYAETGNWITKVGKKRKYRKSKLNGLDNKNNHVKWIK